MSRSAFRLSPMASDSLWTGARALSAVFLVLLLVLLTRLVMTFFWDVPLAIDEAQYLVWSRELQAGYFSKPPFIAWAIAASTGLCGSETAGCVRMLQPPALGLASLAVGLTAWTLWRSLSASVWAAGLFLTMPLVGFYSQIATTDAWLLLWWSWALWAFVWALTSGMPSRSRLSSQGLTMGSNEVAWIVLGAICGLGLLTKYSMAVFALPVAFVLWREGMLLRTGPWLTLLVAMADFSPNLFWNSEWGFPTFDHTLGYAEGKGDAFVNAGNLGEFWMAQFLVMSPLVLLAFLWLSLKSLLGWGQSASASRGPGGSSFVMDAGVRLSLIFAWPMLLVVSLQALTGKVEANWAAPASVGIALAVVGLWCAASHQIFRSRLFGRSMKSLGLPVSLLLNVGFTVAFLALPVGLERLGWAGVAGKDPRVPFVTLETLAIDVDTYLESLPSEARPQFIASKDRHALAYLDARLGREYRVVYWDPGLEAKVATMDGAGTVGSSEDATEVKDPRPAQHHWALQKPLATELAAVSSILFVSRNREELEQIRAMASPKPASGVQTQPPPEAVLMTPVR